VWAIFEALVSSIKRDGFGFTLQRVLGKLSQDTKAKSDSPEWQSDMKSATSKVMPKIVIARKSSGCKVYHAE